MANMYVDPQEPGEEQPAAPAASEPDATPADGSGWVREPEGEIPVEFANDPVDAPAPEPGDLFPGPETPPVEPVPPAASESEPAPVPPTQPGFTPPPPVPPTPPAPPQPLSPQDERTWAMVSHLSVLANVFTGFLGTVAALVIYLAFKDRSRYVAFHALQAFIFQLVVFIGSIGAIIIIWLLTTLLIPVIIGLLCIPFSVLLTLLLIMMPVVALVYGVIGAMQVSEGQDFSYWLVGDWTRRNMPNL